MFCDNCGKEIDNKNVNFFISSNNKKLKLCNECWDNYLVKDSIKKAKVEQNSKSNDYKVKKEEPKSNGIFQIIIDSIVIIILFIVGIIASIWIVLNPIRFESGYEIIEILPWVPIFGIFFFLVGIYILYNKLRDFVIFKLKEKK